MQGSKSDSQIKHAVLEELRWDTRVDETEVGVEVDQGVVTLTGTVASWAKRLAAQQAAHRVKAVRDVANDLQIEAPGRRTDTDLAHAVRHALEWNVMVPDTRITSTVSGGAVTLSGAVDFASQRADAERAVENLDGVRIVSNRIEVVGPQVSPGVVRRAIEAALERHADRTAAHLELDVVDGIVTLSGSVQSRDERDAIVGVARGTLGVKRVEDRLRVVP